MKILVAEDDRASRLVLRGALEEWGYEVECVADGTAAWEALQRPDAPSLAVLDWVMPGMDGIDVCRRVRAELTASYLYLLVLTSKNATEFVVQAMDAGADDFIAKPFQLDELQVRVRAGRRIVELQQELQRRALNDALTGVLNRGAIMQTLSVELARRARQHGPASMVMVDIDHFKRINDAHGHPAGDAVLCEIARRMAAAIRPYDTLGRFGGEEFLIVLPNCSPQSALEVAERIRGAVCTSPIATSTVALDVTASLGVAAVEGESAESPQDLLARADAALYQAKHAGRNRVVLAAPAAPGAETGA